MRTPQSIEGLDTYANPYRLFTLWAHPAKPTKLVTRKKALTALGAWGKFDNLSVFVLTPLSARGQQRGLKQAPNRPLWVRGGKSDNVSVFVLTLWARVAWATCWRG